jgi:hypothetical protein
MSVRLKDRTRQIPNGFRWLQPETGFEPIPWSSFDSICRQLLTHRQGNPWLAQKHKWPMALNAIATQVDAYNAKLCEAHGWHAFIVKDNDAQPDFPTPSLPRPNEDALPAAVAPTLVGKVHRAVGGAHLLYDWLGSGMQPVAKELALARSVVCLKCPLNRLGDFWQRLEGTIAENIRSLVAIKNDMILTLPDEKKLYSCKACDCWLPLKAWVPIEFIKDSTDAETMQKFHKSCWIPKEINNPA